jgi:superfamily I DNA/RNA helicase
VSRDHFLSAPPVAALLALLKKTCGLAGSSLDARVVRTFLKNQDESFEVLDEKLRELRNLPVTDQIGGGLVLVPELAKAFSVKKWRESLKRLLSMAGPFGRDTADYLKTLYLASDQDLYDIAAESVTVMTMHAAKGLEFKVVFVAGCEEGLIPYAKDGAHCEDMDEERRLFFVAMTRARDFLFLSFAKTRTRHGQTKAAGLSPLVADMDRQFLRFEVSGFSGLDKPKKPVQMSLF